MIDFEYFRALCDKLNNPQIGLRCIHVAGTNGKGSTCAFMSSILREAGYERVGLYISPHLDKITERITVDGVQISDSDYTALEKQVDAAWAELNFGAELGYFARITAIAFLYFRQVKCSIVVLETGLGGRFDATNTIESPEVAIITRIGLEHTAELGDTLPKIAGEKAGIIKSGSSVIFAAQDRSVEDVFIQKCTQLNVPYYRTEPLENARLQLSAAYQRENAALALKAAQLLGIDYGTISRGIENAYWPGRFERLCENPTVILDGAHNPNGISALVNSLREAFPNRRITVVFNCRPDKDRKTMIELLEKVAHTIIPVETTITETLNMLMPTASQTDVICICGTLYQAAEVKNYFWEEK
ncbi:MAG: bifunctional folylpolyglutamate synthase/dihydrofolate synthase [Oscillospiraceae bacterium]|jgi:dihydrofolate synthase/folylpolyglutamate synthase|nr:bifunctional folylpolyglutamate synthase/dihydrofolate synthase [Oscillospiraceae bacterium]